MDIFSQYIARYERSREEEYCLQEYLEIYRSDSMAYANSAERLLKAIGSMS